MRVYVTGASGLIGRRIVQRALAEGHEVVALTRDAAKVPAAPNLTVTQIDLRDLPSVLPAIRDCEAGIHAAGMGPGASERELFESNVEVSRNVAGSARREPHLHRLVAISSAAVLEEGDTPYRRIKLAAEQALRSYKLQLTLLRPTLVLAPLGEKSDLATWVERLRAPSLSLPGGGANRIQPVFVDDVAAAAVAALARPESVGQAITLAGPEGGMKLRDFLEEVKRLTGGKARIGGVPLPALRVAALGAGIVGRAARLRAQIRYYGQDHLYPLEEARKLLGFEPTPYADALARCCRT